MICTLVTVACCIAVLPVTAMVAAMVGSEDTLGKTARNAVGVAAAVASVRK